jgi:hypothetical protein
MKSTRRASRALSFPIGACDPHQRSRSCRTRASSMVREILTHIDSFGVLRRPTRDGVRVLLLVLGIAEGQSVVLKVALLYTNIFFQMFRHRLRDCQCTKPPCLKFIHFPTLDHRILSRLPTCPLTSRQKSGPVYSGTLMSTRA